MIITKSIFRTFLLLLPLASFTQNDGFHKIEITRDFRSTFTKKADNILNLQANFKQEKYISYLDASVVSKGFFYFQKPNSIRWEFNDPYQYTIIVNNGTLHIYDAKGEMNFKEQDNEFFDHLNILVQNALSGNVFSENKYEISLMESNSQYRLTINPNDVKIKDLLIKVDIYLLKQNLTVESLVIYETSGDNTSITFSNRQYNRSIDPNLFE